MIIGVVCDIFFCDNKAGKCFTYTSEVERNGNKMRRARKSGLFAKKKTQSRRTENKTRKYVKGRESFLSITKIHTTIMIACICIDFN